LPPAAYNETNRLAWNALGRKKCDATIPYSDAEFAQAKHILDPDNWIDWARARKVLCIGCGGGQQAPLFASLDRDVTSFDLSESQLERDVEVARSRGLKLECVQGDMLDLTQLAGRKYDLVYQAISTCYVPEVRSLYSSLPGLLISGGQYLAEHWHPIQMQLEGYGSWNGRGYEIVNPQISGVPIEWITYDEDGEPDMLCWHYIHSLDELIGGLCETGFVIEKFAETRLPDLQAAPGTYQHLAAYVPPFLKILARSM
jgi:SAM-dependent methyltransferase